MCNIESYVQAPVCSTNFNWLVKTAKKSKFIKKTAKKAIFLTVTQIVTFPGNYLLL